MANLRLSLLITFFSTNGATLVNFLVTIILARLLSPSEIGIFSISAVVISIAHIFRDFGVSSYLQREKDLTPEKIRSAIGVLIFSSWSIALFIAGISSFVAEYYQQDGVRSVMRVLAIGFVFIPFGAITHTLLTREFKAKEQALVNIAGTTAYASSSIILASLDFSYMTMAWANLINIIVTALAYAPFRPKNAPWMPSFKGWGKVVSFGTGAILGNCIGAINTAIPDLFLGKLSGPYDVGIVSRATSTTNIFIQVAGPTVNYAVLPFLAKKHHAGEPLREPMEKAIAYLTGIAWPIIILTGVFAEPVIVFLYGNKWLECVPVLRIICAIAAMTIPFSFTSTALLAIGKPYLSGLPNGVSLLVKVPAILWLYDGSVNSFIYGLLVSTVLSFPFSIWVQMHYLQISLGSFLKAQEKSLLITVVCVLTGAMVEHFCRGLQPLFQLIIAASVLVPVWIAMVKIIRHLVWDEFVIAGEKYHLVGRLLGISTTK